MNCHDVKPRVPPELHDMVIDHLRDSVPALRSCALVCKPWLPRARSYIFEKIILGIPRSSTCQRFLELIETQPVLCGYVHHLQIVNKSDGPTIASILQMLRDLESLHFGDVYIVGEGGSWPENILIAILSMQHLRSLEVCAHISSDPLQRPVSTFYRYVSGLSRLKRLNVGALPADISTVIWKAACIAQGNESERSCLREVGVYLPFDDDRRGQEEARRFNELLRRVGPGLRKLTLNVDELEFGLDTPLSAVRELQLSLCTNLRQLQIDMSLGTLGLPECVAVEAVAVVLESLLPAVHLKTLLLNIVVDDWNNVIDHASCTQALRNLDAKICALPHVKTVTLQSRRKLRPDEDSAHRDVVKRVFGRIADTWVGVRANQGILLECKPDG